MMHANEEPIAQNWSQAFALNPPSSLKAVCCMTWNTYTPPPVRAHPREDHPPPTPGGRLPSDGPPPPALNRT